MLYALSDAIESVKGTRTPLEPETVEEGSQRRNDLGVWGSAELEVSNSEHDVKVYSILGASVHKSTGRFNTSSVTAAPLKTDTEWDKTLIFHMHAHVVLRNHCPF
jgi:hypothetical protein